MMRVAALDVSEIPKICETRRQPVRKEVAVVGDGTYLRLSEAVARLAPHGYSADRVRQVTDAGYLRSTRPPAAGRAGGVPHRRIEAASLDEYEAVLRLPVAERDAALEAMRARNLAQMGIAGPAAE